METQKEEFDALKKAIEYENKGRDFYLKCVEKTNNKIVKETFKFLADEELKHIEKIKQFDKVLSGKSKDFDFKQGNKNHEETKDFFGKTVKEFDEKVTVDTKDIEAYKVGMDLEKTSYDFYKENFEKAENERLKEFFKFLMEQESFHYQLLNNALEYIQNPDYWNLEEEKWMFEG